MSRWTGILVALGALGQAGIVCAQAGGPRSGTLDETLRVEPSADGCVTKATLQPRVQRWLGATPIRSGLRVIVRGAAEPMAFSVQHDAVDFAERSFDVLPKNCTDRVDAVALTIALAIQNAEQAETDEGATTAAAAPPTAPSTTAPVATPPANPPANPPAKPAAKPPAKPTATPKPPAKPTAKPAAKPAPAKEKPPNKSKIEEASAPDDAATTTPDDPDALRVRLHAAATFLSEVLPESALGLGFGAELQTSRAQSVMLTGLYVPQTAQALATGSVLMQLYGGRALLCLGSPTAGLVLEGCVGAAGGAVLATGSDYNANADAKMAWVAGVLRGAARFPERGLIGVRLAVDGLINAVRPTPQLVLDGATKQALAFPIGFAGSLELLIALP